jgi:membrane protease YdiL (CAAX protease family)
MGCDAGVERAPWIAKQLRYKEGVYDFSKVVRRALMVAAVVLFAWQARRLKIAARARSAFLPPEKALRRLLSGFLLGLVSLSLYTTIQWLAGARVVELNLSQGALVVAGKLAKYMVSALAVGVAEELLFRAILVPAFAEGTGAVFGVSASSFLYSILHFFRGSYHVVPDGRLDALIGLRVLGRFAHPLVSSEIVPNLPEVVGLFLTGVVLAVALVHTGKIYLSIGLHAGWVFVLKASKLLLEREVVHTQWLFGAGGGAGGVLSWAMLLGVLAIIVWRYPCKGRSAAGAGDGRKRGG